MHSEQSSISKKIRTSESQLKTIHAAKLSYRVHNMATFKPLPTEGAVQVVVNQPADVAEDKPDDGCLYWLSCIFWYVYMTLGTIM